MNGVDHASCCSCRDKKRNLINRVRLVGGCELVLGSFDGLTCGNGSRHGCGAVKEILYLTPYGDVLPCPFLHISLGNALEESVKVIRQRALQNPYFAVYYQKCLASTDEEFIERYLSKTFEADQLPLRWDRVFTPQEAEKRK